MSYSIAVTGQALLHGPVEVDAPACRAVLDVLGGDAALANLEATVEVKNAWPTKTKTLHLATQEALTSLRRLGLTAVGHANNHAFDLGPPGIEATHAAALAADLAITGSGMSLIQATTPAVRGRIALLAADLGPQPEIVYAGSARAGISPLRLKRSIAVPSPDFAVLKRMVTTLGDDRREAARSAVGYRGDGPAGNAIEVFGTEVVEGDAVSARWKAEPDALATMVAAITALRADDLLVAVSLHSHHWDPDWRRTPHWTLDVAKGLIDAGASIVFGTGAPVLQGMTMYKGRPIFGGLGNLIFHTRRSSTYDDKGVDVWRSAIARTTFAADGTCEGIEILPVAVGRPSEGDRPAPAPVPLTGADADEIFARVVADLTPDERRMVRRA